jgi:hypothetical protein
MTFSLEDRRSVVERQSSFGHFRWRRADRSKLPSLAFALGAAVYRCVDHQREIATVKKLSIRAFVITGLAAAAMATALPNAANARFYDPSVPSAAPLAEQVACRTVRTRTVHRGRTVYKTVRRCTPNYRRSVRRCVNERVRVRTPAGSFVFRTVRRCR